MRRHKFGYVGEQVGIAAAGGALYECMQRVGYLVADSDHEQERRLLSSPVMPDFPINPVIRPMITSFFK